MKLQLQTGSLRLRLRLNEAELAALLAGEVLRMTVRQGRAPLLALEVRLDEATRLDGTAAAWRLTLPGAELRAYAGTLPRRDALPLVLEDGLRLDFEVDVRDSLQVRGPRRR